VARGRRDPFRRPPPTDPYGYERTVEETARPRARTPFEMLWFWLALAGVALLTAVVVVLLVRDDEDERRPRRAVVLPAVVGADHVEAADALERLGLGVETFPVDGPDPAGRVTEQQPARRPAPAVTSSAWSASPCGRSTATRRRSGSSARCSTRSPPQASAPVASRR